MKCECDKQGILYDDMKSMYDKENELPFVKHEPNNCLCKNELKLFKRNGKSIILCSNCCLPSDEEI